MAAGSGETISRPPPPPTPPPYPFLRAPVRGHGEPTRARARARTQTLLTFGGAFSNHLAAAAAAGAACGLATVGLVRGEEGGPIDSPTLRACREHGTAPLPSPVPAPHVPSWALTSPPTQL